MRAWNKKLQVQVNQLNMHTMLRCRWKWGNPQYVPREISNFQKWFCIIWLPFVISSSKAQTPGPLSRVET
ncbi:hypothetical protein RchiOBHm_Chr2g0129241 [Rosa chinensis]|uniref:Uncharacterized protein n=1 Tax=Rosa chinensis TaxID=74649 RepID=A0A2P6RUI8_ROSCH|nr:hypothetical protein RchiOBHm_Chr2g0129241 [Rosa chinensis]